MEIEQSHNSGVQVRSEILMDRRGQDKEICNVLATIAFHIIKNGWRVRPGVVFESMVEMYVPNAKLPHVYFTAPFQWNDMGRVHLTEQDIFPLVAVPVSEAESQLAANDGGRELESLWVSRGTDVLNWERESAA